MNPVFWLPLAVGCKFPQPRAYLIAQLWTVDVKMERTMEITWIYFSHWIDKNQVAARRHGKLEYDARFRGLGRRREDIIGPPAISFASYMWRRRRGLIFVHLCPIERGHKAVNHANPRVVSAFTCTTHHTHDA